MLLKIGSIDTKAYLIVERTLVISLMDGIRRTIATLKVANIGIIDPIGLFCMNITAVIDSSAATNRISKIGRMALEIRPLIFSDLEKTLKARLYALINILSACITLVSLIPLKPSSTACIMSKKASWALWPKLTSLLRVTLKKMKDTEPITTTVNRDDMGSITKRTTIRLIAKTMFINRVRKL